MARRLLERGEWPIFVWKVGYQGTLIEVPAVAFMFRLFGYGPQVIDYAPALFFTVLVFVYVRSVSETFGRNFAVVAALLAVVSAPELYGAILRTQPNYTQTFIYGSALIWIYLRMLRGAFEGRGVGRAPFWLGLLAGWGLYTYGQIVYFIGAILLHASALFFSRFGLRSAAGEILKSIYWPLRILNWIGAADLIFGLVSLVFGFHHATLFGREMEWNAIAATGDGVKICAIAWLFGFVRLYWSSREVWARPWIIAFLGAGLGFSPKLYYNWVESLPSMKKMGLGGDLPLLLSRAKWLYESLARAYSLTPWDPVTVLIGCGLLVSLGLFLALQFRLWLGVALGKFQRARLLEVSPWSALAILVPLAFVSADTIRDGSYGRYALVLVYLISIGLSWVYDVGKPEGRWLGKAAAAVLILAVLLNNGSAFVREFRAAPARPEWVDLVEDLETHGPRKGYADYWVAYVATLYSQGKIVLDPRDKSLSPEDVRASIEAEPRIAWIEPEGSAFQTGKHLRIRGSEYAAIESRQAGHYRVFTLQKL